MLQRKKKKKKAELFSFKLTEEEVGLIVKENIAFNKKRDLSVVTAETTTTSRLWQRQLRLTEELGLRDTFQICKKSMEKSIYRVWYRLKKGVLLPQGLALWLWAIQGNTLREIYFFEVLSESMLLRFFKFSLWHTSCIRPLERTNALCDKCLSLVSHPLASLGIFLSPTLKFSTTLLNHTWLAPDTSLTCLALCGKVNSPRWKDPSWPFKPDMQTKARLLPRPQFWFPMPSEGLANVRQCLPDTLGQCQGRKTGQSFVKTLSKSWELIFEALVVFSSFPEG